MAGRDVLTVGLYFVIYLAYLFVHAEHELWHWLTLVALPIVLLISLRARDGRPATVRAALGDAGLFRRPPWTTTLVALVIVALSIWLQLHGRRAGEIRQTIDSGAAVYLFPLAFLLMIGTAETTEEFFFRGVLQARVHRASRSMWIGIGASTLAFAAFHVPYAYQRPGWGVMGQLDASVAAAAGTGIPYGLILGLLYAKSGNSLPLTIATHALVNATPGMIVVKRMLFAE